MSLKIFIGAGERSGDLFGSRLMRALKDIDPHITFIGIGGPLMRQQGLHTSLFPMEDLSIIGIMEVVPKLFTLLQHLRHARRMIQLEKPDLILTIDAPDFYLRLLKNIKRPTLWMRIKQWVTRAPAACISIPTCHYNAPAVWASRPQRAQHIASYVDHLLCLFPMDPPYFTPHGMKATFIGHPLADHDPPAAQDLPAHSDPLNILVLLGSRAQEVRTLTEPFLDACARFYKQHPTAHFMIPTFESYRHDLVQALNARNLPYTLFDQQTKYQAFQSAHLALAASGTVTLELARYQIPCLVGYKVSPLTYAIARHIVTTPYICLINIVLNEPCVMECIQGQCTGDVLFQHLERLYTLSQMDRSVLQAKLKKAYESLRPPASHQEQHPTSLDHAVMILKGVIDEKQ